jgi:hypothetical protein
VHHTILYEDTLVQCGLLVQWCRPTVRVPVVLARVRVQPAAMKMGLRSEMGLEGIFIGNHMVS